MAEMAVGVLLGIVVTIGLIIGWLVQAAGEAAKAYHLEEPLEWADFEPAYQRIRSQDDRPWR